ncbi:hypothetical protein CIPAW_05G249100 [Carya illinoinensis]|uniref:Uncharacterized protein n=1 Tax=Carya illinoinensis TaxID=32201 RepID=A0A8T1QM64_CARIL|nr:hypothetical protein CIPAW_05G249100 [Carya illinoinensis]
MSTDSVIYLKERCSIRRPCYYLYDHRIDGAI